MPHDDDQPKLIGRNRVKARWIVLLVLTALVVTIAVSERQRPGTFYDVVWARIQGFRDYGDAEALDNRQVAADFARAAARWPGVSRVGWPDVQVYDGDRGRLDPQLASFAVIVDQHDGSVPDLARRALDQSGAAAELELRLDVTLQLGDVQLVVTDASSANLSLALSVVEQVRQDPRIAGGSVSLAWFSETPGDRDPFHVVLDARDPDDVDRVRRDFCGRVEEAGHTCRVDGPVQP